MCQTPLLTSPAKKKEKGNDDGSRNNRKNAKTAARLQAETKTDIVWFALLVWIMSLLCAVVLRGSVDFAALQKSPGWAWGVLILFSFVPTLAALGTQLLRTGSMGGFTSGWRWPALRWMAVALFVPCAYATFVAVLTWGTGAGGFDGRAFVRTAAGALGTGWASPRVVAWYYGALTLFGGTLLLSVFALGEEMGWSGFVIPRLLPQLGVPRTALVTGLLWSSYHFPLILFAKNYTQGTSTVFTLFALTVALTGMAFVSVWLRTRTGSLWPMVLLHASHNVWMFYLYEPMTRSRPLTPYVGGEHGVGMMFAACVMVFLVTRATRKAKTLPGFGQEGW